MLTFALAATALFAGVAGTWSPCGLSVVDTLGSAARRGERSTSVLTFTLGAVAGGAAMFGGLAALGQLLHTGATPGSAAAIAAIAIVAVCAFADALNLRVAPQIRRQVPESWRRRFPAPVTLGLYGLLLGLGFTTFVLSFATWALAAVAFLLGSVATGVVVGVAFGVGRSLPMLLLLPRLERLSERMQRGMTLNPRWLHRVRLAASLAAVAAAVALTVQNEESSIAASVVASDGVEVSVAGDAIAWRTPGGGSVLLSGGVRTSFAANDIAIGGSMLALKNVGSIVVSYRSEPSAAIATVPVGNATGVAVSDSWIVWRESPVGGREVLVGVQLPSGTPQILAQARRGEQLSRPSLDGARLVFARNSGKASSIILRDMTTGSISTLRKTTTITQLRDPSILGDRLLMVRAHACYQQLLLSGLGKRSRARVLLETGGTAKRDAGFVPGRTTQGRKATMCPRGTKHRISGVLSSTALGANNAYVTQIQPQADQSAPSGSILAAPFG